MASNIHKLIEDIYILLDQGKEVSDQDCEEFGKRMADLMKTRLATPNRKPYLSMSNLGKPDRQLWYSINTPKDGEPLRPQTRMTFLLGDIAEEVVIFLAEQTGKHTVEGKQDTLEVAGVTGHRDVVIDGFLVDVKSASSRSFFKFKSGKLTEDDPFGYIDQLNLYLEGSQQDEKVQHKDAAAFLVVNKEVGGLHLDVHPKKLVNYEEIAEKKQEMLSSKEPPARCFPAVPDGKSGNMKLGVNCSYCAFKKKCWPGLRTFLYSGAPRHLTKVVREPDVMELK